MNEYEEQAEKFLKETNTKFEAEFVKNGLHFEDDKEPRDIYKITLTRGSRSFSFMFGQSLNDSGLRLFNDKEKTKRTGHKSFTIPEEVRQRMREAEKKAEEKGFISTSPKVILRNWFEKEYFSLGGICWDLGKKPTAYDFLSCIEKNEYTDFKDFCDSFGYDEDSRKAEKTFKAVQEEYKKIAMLFDEEEINELQEIQ